ncbi:MAG: GIY-YIG nuclease family protein, partial [Bacteroidetes bacterium]|nr:GIY-YIG nuclease family protein [Bacteroidota bacterium]
QADYKTYGENNFAFEILDKLEPKDDLAYDFTDDLKVLEELWIDKLQPFGDKGYNKKVGK